MNNKTLEIVKCSLRFYLGVPIPTRTHGVDEINEALAVLTKEKSDYLVIPKDVLATLKTALWYMEHHCSDESVAFVAATHDWLNKRGTATAKAKCPKCGGTDTFFASVEHHKVVNVVCKVCRGQAFPVEVLVISQTNESAGAPLLPRRNYGNCMAGEDGDCDHKDCPQLRDGEPAKTGRSCPLWTQHREDE